MTDLVPHVGADLGIMEDDTQRMRQGKPNVVTGLKTMAGIVQASEFIESKDMVRTT